ncbi:DNA-binding response regulator, OmpR family, contains REC and winged-helix (wHTH) domain [Jannaschia faecimaris]|uniref:DNA-binding response regulator, OmpR family, contains REC and winged-helix (WHTH) domain n=1 Tax=Jannaschia faecimaris TaxID=1244108 RepID=A0A1H3SRI6_9RHOB|nr:response regulator transcription factor [Jannaschia faecimaris]SDZ40317.1 DNA-binding response regulator, OmpR family, contains REC and winged-helix (wHTH) domain [Jannaschia faecimaris]
MNARRILVIDDEEKIRALLRKTFESEGFDVDEAADIAAARRALSDRTPDLVTLDLNLEREDGLDLAREISTETDIPIIIITGKGDVIDRVVGLELGADDYICKPFHLREVLARVKTIFRRTSTKSRPDKSPEGLLLDGLRIDLDRMEVRDRNGAPCEVTAADIKLLRALVENPMRPLSRDRLMDLVNGTDWSPLDRTIDNQVARLRKKIERDPAHPDLIRTVRGVGYMLTERPEIDH